MREVESWSETVLEVEAEPEAYVGLTGTRAGAAGMQDEYGGYSQVEAVSALGGNGGHKAASCILAVADPSY